MYLFPRIPAGASTRGHWFFTRGLRISQLGAAQTTKTGTPTVKIQDLFFLFLHFTAFSGIGTSQTQDLPLLKGKPPLWLEPRLRPWVSIWEPITKPLIIWLLYLHVISTLALSSINRGLAVCDLSAKSSSERIAGVCQIVLHEGRGREDCLVDLWLPLWFAALSDLWWSPDSFWMTTKLIMSFPIS